MGPCTEVIKETLLQVPVSGPAAALAAEQHHHPAESMAQRY